MLKALQFPLFALIALWAQSAIAEGPIIDIHAHAAWQHADDDAALAATLREMDVNNVVLAALFITSPDDMESWAAAAPDRFVVGPMMPCPRNRAAPLYRCFDASEGFPDLAWLEEQLATGTIGLLGEMLFTYAGLNPNDAAMRTYWELAVQYDVPVGVHTGRGPPPGAVNSPRSSPDCCPGYDGEMGNPELLRPILERSPGLRVWLHHVGAGNAPDYLPYVEETLALLDDFPNVYVDLAITNSVMPVETYQAVLRQLIDRGHGDRIMFGTDGLPPAMILARMQAIEWLSEEQRRAILYDNAARFLQLTDAEIVRHHQQVPFELE